MYLYYCNAIVIWKGGAGPDSKAAKMTGSLVVLSLVCLLLCQINYLSDLPMLQEAFLHFDFSLILALS